jgi:hypothetical protein
MKRIHSIVTLLLLLAASNVSGQTKPETRLTAYVESRQGNHPDGPDMIGHAEVSKGDTVRCTLVGVYDESRQSSTACVIRFGSGPKNTLALNESISAPEDSEAYLECAGYNPRRCAVKVTTQRPQAAAHQTD